MKTLWWVALILTVVGALNWGLVGLFQFDLVAYLFSSYLTGARVVYALVGLAGVVTLVLSVTQCKTCKS